MPNILITGIHGFVGSNLELVRDIDVVIHLAGKAHDTKNFSLYFNC